MDNTWHIQHSEVIDSRNICQAMSDLIDEHMEKDSEGDWVCIPVDRWPAERRTEFAEYDRIITEIKQNAPSRDISINGDAVILIAPTFFTEYVKYECQELYGNDLHETDRWGVTYKRVNSDRLVKLLPQLKFVDWQAYADSRREEYTKIDIDGITYLYEGY